MPGNVSIETADWKAARTAVASGVTLRNAASSLGLDYELLKKKAQREHWDRPHRAIKQARAAQKTLQAHAASLSPIVPKGSGEAENVVESCITTLSAEEKAGTVILNSAQELAESGSLMGARLVFGLLKDASKPEAKLAPLVDVKDVSAAVRTLRLAGGLDRAQQTISLNLWGSGQNVHIPVPGDVRDIVECEDE